MNLLTKYRFFLKYFGLFQVAMIGWVRPKLVLIDDETMVVKIPLTRRTRNHLKSMYFGTLAVGADIAGGIHGFYHAKEQGLNVSLVFKSFQASFLKRPESDVYFVSSSGLEIKNMLTESINEKKRVNKPISIKAYTDYPLMKEPVAEFILELSIKVQSH